MTSTINLIDTNDAIELEATPEQITALVRKFVRNPDGSPNIDHFKSRAYNDFLNGCIMIQWCGMWLGIEPDGYTHS